MRLATPLIALTVLCLRCGADDWPRWRGPDGTGHVPKGVALPRTLPAAPRVVWRVKAGPGHGSPVVAGRRAFYLDSRDDMETLHAVEADTGKELWTAAIDGVFSDLQSEPGPRGTPLVDGDRVYVQSCKGEFQCRSVADGKLVWRTSFVKDHGAVFIGETGDATGAARHGYTGAPLIDGERMYVAVGGTSGSGVVCFDKKTGGIVWKSQNDVAGHAGPVPATIGGVKQVVCFTADGVIGLDARSGELLWREAVTTRLGRHIVTPVVIGDTVVVGSFTQGLIGIRIAREGATFRSERAWTLRDMAVNFASPVAIGGTVYGVGPARTLFAVNARTGEKTWAEQRFFGDTMRTDHAGFIVMGSSMLALTDGGQLLMIAAGPEGCKETGRATVCGRNWCNPAYARGRLFVRDAEEVICVELMPSGR